MQSQPASEKLDDASARHLAVAASVDPRSVKKEYRQPGSVRGEAGLRIRRLFAEIGLRSGTSPSTDNPQNANAASPGPAAAL